MKTLQEIIDKRNEYFEQIMDNLSFAMVYGGEIIDEETEDIIMEKLRLLDMAIGRAQNGQTGGPSAIEEMEKLLKEIEEYL